MNGEPTPFEALMACREAAGSDSQMARDLSTNQPRIWRIINSSKRLPAEYVLLAERLYGVSRHYLRPDIYPRGLVDDVPYDVEEPSLPMIGAIVPSNRINGFDGRDRRSNGTDRFYGAATQ